MLCDLGCFMGHRVLLDLACYRSVCYEISGVTWDLVCCKALCDVGLCAIRPYQQVEWCIVNFAMIPCRL